MPRAVYLRLLLHLCMLRFTEAEQTMDDFDSFETLLEVG